MQSLQRAIEFAIRSTTAQFFEVWISTIALQLPDPVASSGSKQQEEAKDAENPDFRLCALRGLLRMCPGERDAITTPRSQMIHQEPIEHLSPGPEFDRRIQNQQLMLRCVRVRYSFGLGEYGIASE